MKASLFVGVTLVLSVFSALAFECKVIEPEPENRRYNRALIDGQKGVPRTVQIVYFSPSDTSFNPEVVENIQLEIRNIRVFYAQQMEKHGHGWTTFGIEANRRGIPIVHKIKGQHPESYYRDNGILRTVRHELESKFDTSANIYLIVVELVNWNKIDGADGRGGRFGKTGGMVLVPDEYWLRIAQGEDDGIAKQMKTWRNIIAHELGHAFGLEHNFHDDTYMMAYGESTQMSECSTDFLSVHPFLNSDIPTEEGEILPDIQLLSSPKYPEMAQSAELQISASSPHGIHQVTLLSQTPMEHFAYGYFELKDCQKMLGNETSIVVFDYDGVIPSVPTTRLSDSTVHYIRIQVVTLNGDVSDKYFNIIEKSPYHIATLDNGSIVGNIAFSPDSKKFAISTDGAVDATTNLWSTESLQIIGSPKIDRPPPYDFIRNEVISRVVAFSPDNRFFATCDINPSGKNNALQLWDVETLQLLKHFGDHPGFINSIVFTPNGQKVIIGSAGFFKKISVVKVWDIITEQNTMTFQHFDDDYYGVKVTCSPDGKIIASSAGNDGMFSLLDSVTGHEITNFDTLLRGVGNLEFSPDGKILAVAGVRHQRSNVNPLQLWDVVTGNTLLVPDMNVRSVGNIDFFPDGSALAIVASEKSYRREVKILDLKTKEIIATFGHLHTVMDAKFSPDGSLLVSTAYESQTIELWDMSWWNNQSRLRKIFKIEDINTDGVVDIQDLVIVASELNTKEEKNMGDINNDGVVDIRDLVLVVNAMEK